MTSRQTKEANLLISESADFNVTAKMQKMPKGYIDKWHQHPWHQIIFPFEGIVQTKVANSQFVIPHSGMLFIPANTPHESFALTDTQFIGIYLKPVLNPEFNKELNKGFNKNYPLTTKAISVTPFLRELILQIKNCVNNSVISEQEISNLLAVLIDQISAGQSYKMTLILPIDRRLMTIFKALMTNPQRDTKLSEWAKKVGASERTLSRLFTKELGMTFPLWRQHLRLISSLSLLESKLSVQEVAFKVGYNSDSSFIYAFKNLYKQTPQQYRNSGFRLGTRINAK
ncbi:AraC family transcriptional regulator [Colwellia psychrerythraea]|uniref:Transcriptional regulator, AraC family n=1 Tax=Colwellia psychrerythraea TaxID=28229 RepID=A0A099KL35_COLPS|nr:helix-turn-helix transcriptional regulator [Colwellia psychrerythraea]KGJ90980.1 transcriptional regulator, AraC family [Colwellia psychrerythraea]